MTRHPVSEKIKEAAERYGRSAANRLHHRVRRGPKDREEILGMAKIEINDFLQKEGADPATGVMARNLMFIAFASYCNELYLQHSPGGKDFPVEAVR